MLPLYLQLRQARSDLSATRSAVAAGDDAAQRLAATQVRPGHLTVANCLAVYALGPAR